MKYNLTFVVEGMIHTNCVAMLNFCSICYIQFNCDASSSTLYNDIYQNMDGFGTSIIHESITKYYK